MSGQIGTVRNIRVFVEPVDVELDEDDGLLWTSLQTAFPGCSGMYFRDRDSTCKSSVKFDGKKFRAPGGSWNDREYYVTLSQRCHSAQMGSNFGNYESATKQFEKSVSAVQKMLASTMGGGSRLRLPSTVFPPSPPTEKSEKSIATTNLSSSPPTSEPIHDSLQEREHLLRSTTRTLTPLEQQFVDLAKISTGKDAVIEGHRDEIRNLKEKVADVEKLLSEAQKMGTDFELRSKAQEEELRLLRELGEQQKCMNNQVADLSSQLEKREREIKDLQKTLAEKDEIWKRENEELREKCNTLSGDLSQKTQALGEISEQLQVSQVSRDLLAKELDQLRPLAELIELDDPENVQKYADTLSKNYQLEEKETLLEKEVQELQTSFEELQTLQAGLAVENTRMTKRNTELEERLAHVDSELTKINESWKNTLQEKQNEYTLSKTESDEEIETLKNRLAEVQKMLEVATRDATENARRLSEVSQSRDEFRRAYESSEFRQQEPLKRKIRNLSDDLREAEDRVAELTGLVASLTSDAHNSQRDMDDLI